MTPGRFERLIVAVLVGLAMLWLGIKDMSVAMPLVFRVPVVLMGAAGMTGPMWWMGRQDADESSQ